MDVLSVEECKTRNASKVHRIRCIDIGKGGNLNHRGIKIWTENE